MDKEQLKKYIYEYVKEYKEIPDISVRRFV